MLCAVSVLGSRQGGASAAAGRIVDYLKGQRPDQGSSMRPGEDEDGPRPSSEESSRYYGDSAEGAGRWLGSGFGATQFEGAVESAEFLSLLEGVDPHTGENLVGTMGSSTRAGQQRADAEDTPTRLSGKDRVGIPEAADYLGVSRSYLKRLAAETAKARASGEDVPETYLDATRTSPRGRWQIETAELQRFAAAREGQAVVLGYDVTFSCPKSVSLLWAMGDREMRTEILDAIESSVGAGIGYLEANGCTIKVGGELVVGEGLLAAGFLHATSRALDPQLHWHCVVLNATVAPDGTPRAIDGRGLFAHAKTAGYLAGAQLRHELTDRLGVAWDEAHNGLADITGIDRDTIEAFSKRSTEIDEVADAAGLSSAAARQAAALASRSAKQGVLAEDLIDGWHQELTDRGYTTERIGTLFGHEPRLVPFEQDRRRLVAELLSAHGITETSAVFDRRDVLQRISEWAGDRLSAAEITDLADEFLCHPEVVRLDTARPGSVIRRADGRTVTAGTGATYSTVTMLTLERDITNRFVNGFDQGVAIVEEDILQAAIDRQPSLGADQEDMVRVICTSGDRVQLVLGPAGAGKTFALEVAARAWEADGHRVIGTAVAGVAAEVLANSVGVPTTTVASLLTRLDTTGPEDVLDARTVVLVDEASTVGTRDLAGLLRWADRTGATLRLVGDPAQHSAVAAGGMFRHLLGRHPERVPVLTENRRQVGDDMAEVRLALAEYRDGQISKALERLDGDQRIVTADTADELLDALVADWYVDRRTRTDDPTLAASSMIAEHHFERRELNTRARALLAADGTLAGPVLEAADQIFQAGDEVIARAQDRALRPDGGGRGSHVRNGTRGTVLDVSTEPGREGLLVAFDRKGEVFVPRAFLEAEVRRGVVGGLIGSAVGGKKTTVFGAAGGAGLGMVHSGSKWDKYYWAAYDDCRSW
jgi:conjugative relaxase-like TrwC/TraI family protein